MNSFLGKFYRHLAIFFWSHCTNSLLNCPKVVGHGPRSDLIITPLDLQYFGRYTCKAVNPHGEAFFEIDLSQTNYDGSITLELSPHEFPQDETLVIDMLQEIRAFLVRETTAQAPGAGLEMPG